MHFSLLAHSCCQKACPPSLSGTCLAIATLSDQSLAGVCRYSFGTGAQVLPIPELMPFRLTRQMRGALQPHDACALLRTPCALGMAALRAGAGILEVCVTLPLDMQCVESVPNLHMSSSAI